MEVQALEQLTWDLLQFITSGTIWDDSQQETNYDQRQRHSFLLLTGNTSFLADSISFLFCIPHWACNVELAFESLGKGLFGKPQISLMFDSFLTFQKQVFWKSK